MKLLRATLGLQNLKHVTTAASTDKTLPFFYIGPYIGMPFDELPIQKNVHSVTVKIICI